MPGGSSASFGPPKWLHAPLSSRVEKLGSVRSQRWSSERMVPRKNHGPLPVSTEKRSLHVAWNCTIVPNRRYHSTIAWLQRLQDPSSGQDYKIPLLVWRTAFPTAGSLVLPDIRQLSRSHPECELKWQRHGVKPQLSIDDIEKMGSQLMVIPTQSSQSSQWYRKLAPNHQ